MRKTSREALDAIRANGWLAVGGLIVYEFLFENGPLTTRQVYNGVSHRFRELGMVAAQLTTLRKKGVIYETGEVKCETTGHTVIQWDVNDRLPTKIEKPKKIKCEHCQGTGFVESVKYDGEQALMF